MASEDEVVIDLRKMKIPELKKELQIRGLKIGGNKHDLIERLQQYLEEHEGAEVADDEILKEVEGEADDHLIDDQKLEDSVLTAPPEQAKAKDKEVVENDTEADTEKKGQGEESENIKDLHSPTGLSDAEKLKMRAQKFGVTVSDMNTEARKAARSERFGTGGGTAGGIGTSPGVDPDKLKKRAERFGAVVSDTLSKSEEEERRRKRQARFGIETTGGTVTGPDSEKKKKRAERFGLTV